ncbi:hypothetical protein ACFO3O_09220 [Dokdonia ponticola]|uniref:Uncharacterized protein n=1 Tax=Dokdonia ponticola TaxID=2041041 RepID=A0ABV9HX70_9FLAO
MEIILENENRKHIIEIGTGELFRINCNSLKAYNDVKNIGFPLEAIDSKKWLAKINSKLTLQEYLEIVELNISINNYFNDSELTTKINDFPKPYIELLASLEHIRTMPEIARIYTGGMHLMNLKFLYSNLLTYLKNGGMIIEINYPPIIDFDLDQLINQTPKELSIS